MDIRGSQPLQETLNLLPNANRSTDTERKHLFYFFIFCGGFGLAGVAFRHCLCSWLNYYFLLLYFLCGLVLLGRRVDQ